MWNCTLADADILYGPRSGNVIAGLCKWAYSPHKQMLDHLRILWSRHAQGDIIPLNGASGAVVFCRGHGSSSGGGCNTLRSCSKAHLCTVVLRCPFQCTQKNHFMFKQSSVFAFHKQCSKENGIERGTCTFGMPYKASCISQAFMLRQSPKCHTKTLPI